MNEKKIIDALITKTQILNLEDKKNKIEMGLSKKLKALTDEEFFEYGKKLGHVLVDRGELMKGSEGEYFARILFKMQRGRNYGT